MFIRIQIQILVYLNMIFLKHFFSCIFRRGVADGNFRVVLGGNSMLKVDISAGAVIPFDEAASFRLHMQLWPRDIAVSLNSTCSAWFDLQGSIDTEAIKVTKSDGTNDDNNIFRRHLRQENAKGAVGASLRWAVCASPNNSLELELQSLPMPEPFLSAKPILRADNIAVLTLQRWQLASPVFDGELLWGPIPILCAEQPEELRSVLEIDPQRHIPELNKLASKFLAMEMLRMADARYLHLL